MPREPGASCDRDTAGSGGTVGGHVDATGKNGLVPPNGLNSRGSPATPGPCGALSAAPSQGLPELGSGRGGRGPAGDPRRTPHAPGPGQADGSGCAKGGEEAREGPSWRPEATRRLEWAALWLRWPGGDLARRPPGRADVWAPAVAVNTPNGSGSSAGDAQPFPWLPRPLRPLHPAGARGPSGLPGSGPGGQAHGDAPHPVSPRSSSHRPFHRSATAWVRRTTTSMATPGPPRSDGLDPCRLSPLQPAPWRRTVGPERPPELPSTEPLQKTQSRGRGPRTRSPPGSRLSGQGSPEEVNSGRPRFVASISTRWPFARWTSGVFPRHLPAARWCPPSCPCARHESALVRLVALESLSRGREPRDTDGLSAAPTCCPLGRDPEGRAGPLCRFQSVTLREHGPPSPNIPCSPGKGNTSEPPRKRVLRATPSPQSLLKGTARGKNK